MKYLTLLLIFTGITLAATAQPDGLKDRKWYFVAGTNLSFSAAAIHGGFNGALTLSRGIKNFGIRYQNSFFIYENGNSWIADDFVSIHSLQALGGINFKALNGLDMSIRSGLTFNRLDIVTLYALTPINPEDHNMQHIYYRFGIPLELNLLPNFSKSSGIEFSLFTNISKITDFGFRLNYRIGNL